jgi:hypothetical protein
MIVPSDIATSAPCSPFMQPLSQRLPGPFEPRFRAPIHIDAMLLAQRHLRDFEFPC